LPDPTPSTMYRARALSGIQRAALPYVPRSMSSVTHASPLPLDPPSIAEENAALKQRVAALEQFFATPRFASTSRPYTAADVASKQGTLPPLPLPSALLADKLYALLDRAAKAGQPVHTIGAIDPVQMTQMARWLEVCYVSGWVCSSLLTTANNEVGPDFGCVVTASGPTVCLTPTQRLSVYNCTKPGPPTLPRPAAS
jgi:hypothetical protein